MISPSTNSRRSKRTMVCLMYHNVFEDAQRYGDLSPSITSYFVGKSVFDAQIRQLVESGKCLPHEALHRFYGISGQSSQDVGHSEPSILLTFDDGWRESVEVAGPILDKHQGNAMLFITTDFIGRRHFLTPSEIRALPTKLFRVGSHARTHRMLNRLSDPEIFAELKDSKRILEDAVGQCVDSLSIPNGAVDDRVRRIASEVGYQFLFTSNVYTNTAAIGPMHIGRVAIKQNTSMRTFQGYLDGRFAWQRLRRCLLTAPRSILGVTRYEMFRRRLLGETAGQQVMQDL